MGTGVWVEVGRGVRVGLRIGLGMPLGTGVWVGRITSVTTTSRVAVGAGLAVGTGVSVGRTTLVTTITFVGAISGTEDHASASYLWDIPDLGAVVDAWDCKVRAELSPDALWYALVDFDSLVFTGATKAGRWRRHDLVRGIKKLCALADVPYRSPHKLRHGHTVYGLELAQNMAEFQAVSQNLIHSNMQTTASIYSQLTGGEVGARIAAVSARAQESASPGDDLLAELRQLLVKHKMEPENT